ncbi:heat shock protein 9/12, partial [Protomyces lactucae-debilis]
ISDTGRKDTHSKIGDKLQPDSSKSTLDKAGDAITGAADKVARDVVPDSQKSTGQSLSDKVSRATD